MIIDSDRVLAGSFAVATQVMVGSALAAAQWGKLAFFSTLLFHYAASLRYAAYGTLHDRCCTCHSFHPEVGGSCQGALAPRSCISGPIPDRRAAPRAGMKRRSLRSLYLFSDFLRCLEEKELVPEE